MYAIYETDAFIVGSTPRGETGKSFLIYTEEFGMIRGAAQAVRKMESKLRPHLVEYSRVRLSLVRGKEIWRITGSLRLGRMPDLLSPNGQAYVRVIALLSRLVAGEAPDPRLFETLSKAYKEIDLAPDAKIFEAGLILKILHILGYIDETIRDIDPKSREAIIAINQAIRQSQL